MYGYPEQFIPQPEYSTGLPHTTAYRQRPQFPRRRQPR